MSRPPIPATGARDTSTISALLRMLGVEPESPEPDLAYRLESLTTRFAEVVDSLVAVILTVTVHDRPYTVSTWRSNMHVVTTVAIPLSTNPTPSVLILAASAPHAFTDVAHDAASELGVSAGIEHDRHLAAFTVTGTTGATELSERSIVDRAVGIILDRGLSDSPEAARVWLSTAAERSDRTLIDVAEEIADNSRR